MSAKLTEQIGAGSVEMSLSKIDSWSEGPSKPGSDGLAVGPFSVIDLNQKCSPRLSMQVDEARAAFSDTPISLETINSLPDYLQWSDLFDLDFENYLASLPELSGNDPNLATDLSDPVPVPVPPSPGPFPPSSIIDDKDLEKEAHSLLRHFSEHVIPSVGALPFNIKSPYQILNVASAVQTLADITYLGRPVTHANAANLNGLLASSAYHLASNPSGPAVENAGYWRSLAVKAGCKAKEHMQMSLQYELSNGNKAKYKDQLMALMSNLTYSISAGLQKDTRCYMVDAERLVRLRGLAKRHISRRARLLHHMYTWIRIVGESTYVLHDAKVPSSTIPKPSRLVTAEIGHNSKLDDFLRLDAVDDDTQYDEMKAPEIGLRDIHLQDPRTPAETMYLQIYGIPETWLSLLSQTTRLANATDALKTTKTEKPEMQKVLDKRAARLEDMICSFAAKTDYVPAEDVYLPPSQYMLRALSSALVLFFYRRIRQVNPWILQSHVDDVISALQKFDTSLSRQNLRGPGTAWPAFIAGCEANAGSRRAALMRWIETAFWKTGLQSFKLAQDMMREVWTRRDQVAISPRSTRSGAPSSLRQTSTTWIEICRENQEWVILC